MEPSGYQIVRKLATGGMAELWLAHRTGRPDDRVALKRILPQFAQDREFVDMFLDEARIASHLRHPNVVRTFEVGSDGSAYFIVMEYLDGENVRAVLRQLRSLGRPLALQHALAILIGTAQGLHYAHEKTGTDDRPLHIVHRDVSPQNILVTWAGEVKLVDFGIAKAAHRATETRVGTMKGKIPYMSPEQCNGEALDRRSDVWSLGAVLYELTVGRRMIRAAPDYLMMKQITEEGVTPPTSILPMYPRELEVILLKALAPRRGQRYQTMAHFASDLSGFARTHGYDLGAASLASMMREAFGGASGRSDDLEDRGPTEEEPLPAALPDVKPRAVAVAWTPGPVDPSRAPATGAPAKGGAPEIVRRKVGPVEVVAVAGRLTEAFRGAELGASLRGDVVLDLSGIQRVTSFGVREWLAMNEASRASSLHLARCTEPIVNQLTMIRGFAGKGRVLSFLAPYVCQSCRTPFSRLVDAEADAQAVRDQIPPAASCPRCGGDGRFDDDPRSYFAIASLLAERVPPAIRAATGPVDTVGRPPLEKRVESGVTHLTVNGRMGPDLRWRNALEGVEGELVVDLSAVGEVQPDAARPMLSALRAARRELRSARVVGVPAELVPELRHEAWLAAEERAATVPAPVPAPPGPSEPAADEAAATRTEVVIESPGPSVLGMGVGVVLMVVGGLAVVATGLAVLAVVLLSRAPEVAAVPPAPVVTSAPLVVGDDAVVATGQGRGASVEEAAEGARRQALSRVVEGVVAGVGRPVRGAPAADPVARYLEAFGAIGTPTRRDMRSRGEGEVVVDAAYELPRRSFDEVVARLSVVELGSLRLGPVLPVEEGDGLWILASSDPELPVGARVVAVDGARIASGGAAPELRGRTVTLVDGERERTVRLP